MSLSRTKTKVLTAFICVVMSVILAMGFAQQTNAATCTIYTPVKTAAGTSSGYKVYSLKVPVKVTATHTKVKVELSSSSSFNVDDKTVTVTSSSTSKVNVSMGKYIAYKSSGNNKLYCRLSYYNGSKWVTGASCAVYY